jgi:hypothetical protein
MMAAGGGHIKSVAILLAAGADRDAKDKVSDVHDAVENRALVFFFANIASHLISCYLMICHVMSCYVMSYHVILCCVRGTACS